LLDIHVYWNILTMHGPINVKSPNNTSKWQMGFNSAFKGLKDKLRFCGISKQCGEQVSWVSLRTVIS
jgi:hypothetical protein